MQILLPVLLESIKTLHLESVASVDHFSVYNSE